MLIVAVLLAVVIIGVGSLRGEGTPLAQLWWERSRVNIYTVTAPPGPLARAPTTTGGTTIFTVPPETFTVPPETFTVTGCSAVFCVTDPCPGQHLPDANGCVNCASPCSVTTVHTTTTVLSQTQTVTTPQVPPQTFTGNTVSPTPLSVPPQTVTSNPILKFLTDFWNWLHCIFGYCA